MLSGLTETHNTITTNSKPVLSSSKFILRSKFCLRILAVSKLLTVLLLLLILLNNRIKIDPSSGSSSLIFSGKSWLFADTLNLFKSLVKALRSQNISSNFLVSDLSVFLDKPHCVAQRGDR